MAAIGVTRDPAVHDNGAASFGHRARRLVTETKADPYTDDDRS